VLGWHVRLSASGDLPQIKRFIPCIPDSGIIFPDVAAMKVWKRLTAILKALGDVWMTGT